MGKSKILLINADHTGLVKLTDNLAADADPSWAPDGRYISFTSDRSGNQDVYSVGADGLGLTRLTNDSAADFGASWAR